MKKYNDKIITIGKAILVFLLFYFHSYFIAIPIALLNINKITKYNRVPLSIFASTCLLIILFLLYRKEIIKEWKIFKKNISKNIDTGFKYWIIGLFGMMVSNILITFVLNAGGPENENQVQSMISAVPWLMLINAGLIAPINEELVFRKTFKNIFKNKWLFILSSGIVFGALHVLGSTTSSVDYLYIIPYSSLGIAFAYMYYKTDTVFTSISMHMLHNTILTLISILI